MGKKSFVMVLVLAGALGYGVAGNAAEDKGTANAPDNTRVNKEHKTMSADQQAETSADRKITQGVRRAIVKNKSLSSYAHNVKIITRGGAVTLKGPVRSEDEKRIVEKAAAEVAGKDNVKNELEIVPPKTEKKSEKKSKPEKKSE